MGPHDLTFFFQALDEDATSQRETGVAPNCPKEMRERVMRIKESFVLPRPPRHATERFEEALEIATAPSISARNSENSKEAHVVGVCHKCGRSFALKKTLAMHLRVCVEASSFEVGGEQIRGVGITPRASRMGA